jgi:hypothetical protein
MSLRSVRKVLGRAKYAHSIPRRKTPGLRISVALEKSEGAGKAGRLMHP